MADDFPDFVDPDDDDGGPPSGANGRRRIRAIVKKARIFSGANGEGKARSAKRDERNPGDAGDGDESFSVETMNQDYAVVLLGSKAVILKEIAAGPIDDRRRFLAVYDFKTLFSNRFVERRAPDGKMKAMSWASAWLLSEQRRAYDGVEFFPDPDNAPGTPRYLNLWSGFAFAPAPKPNGYKTFRDHLLNNVCGGDEKLFAWVFGFFAHIVQHPRERIGVALVLRGGMGTGKTIVGEIIGALFPRHYFLVDDTRYVTGNFNAHMASCLLLQADEAVWAGDKAAEGRLKGLITSPIQSIEAKGIDPIRLMNYVRLIMTSNEDWVVPAGPDERRFAVFDVDPRCAQNNDYFAEMRAELEAGGYAALLHDLLAFDLSKVPLRTIPKTAALLDQKERTLKPVPSWWLGRLESGRSTRHADDWQTTVEKDALFADYIETSDKIGIKRRSEQTIFHREFRHLVPTLRCSRPKIPKRTENGDIVVMRPHCYQLPPLRECRAAWDERMRQPREWPHEDDDEPQTLGESEAMSDF